MKPPAAIGSATTAVTNAILERFIRRLLGRSCPYPNLCNPNLCGDRLRRNDAVAKGSPDGAFGAAKRTGTSTRRHHATPIVATAHPIRQVKL